MDDVGKIPCGKLEVTDIPLMQPYGGISGQMRSLRMKRVGVSSQADQLGPQIQGGVGMGKSLQQPDPEETRGSSDKDPAAAELLPERTRVLQHMLQIFLGKRGKGHQVRGYYHEAHEGIQRVLAYIFSTILMLSTVILLSADIQTFQFFMFFMIFMAKSLLYFLK
jgi:hypothetical protein